MTLEDPGDPRYGIRGPLHLIEQDLDQPVDWVVFCHWLHIWSQKPKPRSPGSDEPIGIWR